MTSAASVALVRARGRAEAPPRILLPIQLLWIALIVPLLLGSLPSAVLGEESWERALRGTLALSLAYLSITGALIVFYRRVAPSWLDRIRSRVFRIAFHVISTAAVAIALGWLLFPAYRAIDPEPLLTSEWLTACTVNAWALALPTLWLSHLIHEVEVKRRTLVEAELAALHAQLNPHFLFNSLNTVASLIAEDPRAAEDTVERLAEVLRYVLETDPRRLVPVSQEIAFAENLLRVHGARFEDDISFTVEVDPSVRERQVPSLLLQPLIENAILHGVASRGRGRIEVVVQQRGSSLLLEVRDDGVGLGGSSHRGSGTGLVNLRQRLALIYGDAAKLRLEPRNDVTCAIVDLPLR